MPLHQTETHHCSGATRHLDPNLYLRAVQLPWHLILEGMAENLPASLSNFWEMLRPQSDGSKSGPSANPSKETETIAFVGMLDVHLSMLVSATTAFLTWAGPRHSQIDCFRGKQL